ncbi:MAG: anti-sigma factor antagonist [Verrucomicrobiia bacterium]
MKLEKTLNGARMTVVLTGRLDAATAPVLGKLVDRQLEGIAELVLDFDGLDYVSSAGLRVILTAQQKMKAARGSMVVKNVSQTIASVFEMTGFDSIVTYERKLRQLSVAGLEMIAKGANGECYKVDDETVVKLYYDYIDEASAAREKKLAKKAFVAGVPTAISYDVVECGNRRGVLYEMLKADTLSKYIEKNVHRLDAVVEMYVGFCKQIHAIAGDPNTFPDAVTLACGYIDACGLFNDSQRAAIKERLLRAERQNTLIHWDLHPGNIMMQGDSPCLIDMGDMAIGTPYFDLGQIKQVLHYYAGMGLCQKIIGLDDAIALRVWSKFVPIYFGNPAPDELSAIEENINFYRAIKNMFLYLSGSGGEAMRSRRKDFIFQMLPKEITELK